MTDGPGPETSTPYYRWVVMGLWLFSNVSGFMVLYTTGVLLPAINSDLHLSPSRQGVLGSIGFWGNVSLALPLTWLASRFSPKRLTSVALVLGTLFLFLQGWASGFLVLLIGRLAFGIAVIAGQPARAILTQQWFRPREFVIVNSVANAVFGVVVGGGLVATPLILVALENNWRGAMYTFGGLFIALTVLWVLFGKEGAAPEQSRREATLDLSILRRALSYRDLWVGSLGFLGSSMAWSGFLNFFPTFALARADIPLQWSGGILAVGVIIGGVSGLWFGYLAQNTRRSKAILQSLGLLLVGTYLGMVLTNSIPVLFLLSFLNGIAWGFWPVLFTVPFHLPGIRPRELAVAVALITMMTSGGTALGPLVTGFLQQTFGDLRLALLMVSFAAVSVSLAGSVLRPAGHAVGMERPAKPMET